MNATTSAKILMRVTKHLALSKIRLDGGTQPRSVLDFETVDEYADLMKAGVRFPAVVVFYDGQGYWLADGFHRLRAAWQIKAHEIEAEIVQGTLEEARWYSFSVNKTHGLRRTNEDKQRAVQAALKHPKSQALSNTQIAKHVGVDEGTIRNWRQKLTTEVPKSRTRSGSDGRTINVSNIGRRAPVVTEPRIEINTPREQPAVLSTPVNEGLYNLADDLVETLRGAALRLCQIPLSDRNRKEIEEAYEPLRKLIARTRLESR